METLIYLILSFFGILQIILFFKIWGMTNDVKQIKEKYLSSNNQRVENTITNDSLKFDIDELVIDIKNNRQMRVKAFAENGKYSCYINGGTIFVGDFSATEIKKFNA